ncbi:MAG: hypothetical protein WDM84_07685 [Bauldia sp.]
MTALGKVVRTTAFKLSAIYFSVFSIFAVFFVLYISYSTNVLLNQQIRETIATELLGLSDQYHVWRAAGGGRCHRAARAPARRQPLPRHRRFRPHPRRQRQRGGAAGADQPRDGADHCALRTL